MNAAASVAMWPASEISASEPASQPPIASTTPKPAVSASAIHSVGASRVARMTGGHAVPWSMAA